MLSRMMLDRVGLKVLGCCREADGPEPAALLAWSAVATLKQEPCCLESWICKRWRRSGLELWAYLVEGPPAFMVGMHVSECRGLRAWPSVVPKPTLAKVRQIRQ